MSTGNGLITLTSQPLSVHWIKLKKAVYVWVGSEGSAPTLSSLVSAVPGSRDGALPAVSSLFGTVESEDLAARLSRRLSQMVLLSFDSIDSVADEISEVEAQMYRLIK